MQFIYPTFVALIFIETLVEVIISRKNSAALLHNGAVDIAPHLLPWMTLVYGVKFLGSIIEYYVIDPNISFVWLLSFGVLVIAAKVLKFWAIKTLGPFWSMKVLIIPGSQTIHRGPYRWIRHPNYVAVITEIIALPLMGKAFITAVIITIAFGFLLQLRITAEEQALMEHTDYNKSMGKKRRFIP